MTRTRRIAKGGLLYRVDKKKVAVVALILRNRARRIILNPGNPLDASLQSTCDSRWVASPCGRPCWGWRSGNDLRRLCKMWKSRNKMSELGIANRRGSAMRASAPVCWKCGGCECQRRGRVSRPHTPHKSHLSGTLAYETWDTTVATAHSCCCLLWREHYPPAATRL